MDQIGCLLIPTAAVRTSSLIYELRYRWYTHTSRKITMMVSCIRVAKLRWWWVTSGDQCWGGTCLFRSLTYLGFKCEETKNWLSPPPQCSFHSHLLVVEAVQGCRIVLSGWYKKDAHVGMCMVSKVYILAKMIQKRKTHSMNWLLQVKHRQKTDILSCQLPTRW